NDIPTYSDDDGGDNELWDGHAKRTMFSDDINMEEMYNHIQPFMEGRNGRDLLKRKSWMKEAEDLKLCLMKGVRGELSDMGCSKRQREEDSSSQAAKSPNKELSNLVR